jgi:putative transposase
VSEYVEHYHTERPHQAKGNVPLTGEWPVIEEDPPGSPIECRTWLGGLLRHYERTVA